MMPYIGRYKRLSTWVRLYFEYFKYSCNILRSTTGACNLLLKFCIFWFCASLVYIKMLNKDEIKHWRPLAHRLVEIFLIWPLSVVEFDTPAVAFLVRLIFVAVCN